MLRKLKATILAFIIITAALPLTAYADVDREAVKDALFTHLWSEASLDHEMGGEYLERAEDNPYAALYYYYYITPFVDESSEETLENLDLSDSTSYSINRFVRNYYAEWESEKPDLIALMIDDGNSYEVTDNQDDKWIVEDQDGNVSEIGITTNDSYFTFTYNGKEVAAIDRLYQYSYLNDEDEIAYEKAEKSGSEPESISSTEEYAAGEAASEITDSNRPVTQEVVSKVDEQRKADAPESSQPDEQTTAEPEKDNHLIVYIVIGAVMIAGAVFFIVKQKQSK